MINGKFYCIDAHCHIYPDKIAAKAVKGTDTFYGIDSVYDGSVGTLLGQGVPAGIDHFLVQSVATTPQQVSSINRFIAQSVASSNGLFTGLGTLHPDAEDIAADVDEIIALGLRGVKLHPDIQSFKIDDYRCLKIYEICEQKGLPVLMHTGDSRYDMSNPNRLKPVLEIYKNLTVIGAHFGGYSVWKDAVNALHGMDNFYVDTSSSFFALSDDEIREYIATYGTDRVLFGTDYPMWDAATEVNRLLSLGLDDESLNMIFCENAKRVFNL